jgi:hypothetical protein
MIRRQVATLSWVRTLGSTVGCVERSNAMGKKKDKSKIDKKMKKLKSDEKSQ